MAVQRNIVVRIGADISQLQKTLSTAKTSIEKFSNSASQVGDSLTKYISVPLAGIGAAVLKAGMDFEQGLSNIKALGATADQMARLRDLAMDMGAKTKYSALQATQGIEELLKAGLTVEQVLGGGLQGAMSLASAGGVELAEAAEIASTVLNAFKKDGLSVAKAADILAGAANASATGVQELQYGLAQVSSIASGVGLTFEDTATALAVMAQSGLKGSDAGTSLKTMLTRLQPATAEQTRLFEKLNLVNEKGQSVFFNTEGKLKSFSNIAGILKNRLKGMTDAQRLSTLQTLFGADAIRAANIVYGSGAEGVNQMKSEMGKVTAEEVAQEKMNNLKGSVEQFKGSLETLGIKLYEMKSGPLKSFVDGLTEMVNKFIALDPTTQQNIVMLAGAFLALGPAVKLISMISTGIMTLIGWITPLITYVGTITTGFALWAARAGTLTEVLLFIGGPIGLITRGVVALIGFVSTITFAFAAWAGGAATLGEALALISGPIGWVIAGIVALGVAAWALIANWDSVKAFTEKTWNGIESFLTTCWNAIKSGATYIWTGIMNFFTIDVPRALDIMVSFFQKLPGRVYAFMYELFFVKIPYAIGYGIGFLLEKTQNGISRMVVFFSELPGKLMYWFNLATDKVVYFANLISEKAMQIGSTFITTIINFVKTLPSKLSELFTQTISFISNFASKAYNAALEVGKSIYNGVIDFVVGLPGKVVEIVSSAIDKVKNLGQGIKNAASSVVNSVKSGFSSGQQAAKVPGFASGGIVTKPTLAMVGEGGESEAIMPLSKLNKMIDQTGGQNLVQVILDGRVIQEYIDNGLGRRLAARGAY